MNKGLMKKTLGILIVVIFITTGLSAGVSRGHDMPASVLNKNGNDASIRLSTKYYDDNCFDKGPGEIINEKSAGSPGATLASIDYDGDGDMDYIEGSFFDIFICTNNQDNFQRELYYILEDYNGYPDTLDAGAIVAVDINNDGQEDFITGGTQGFIRIFINNNSQSGIPQFDMNKIAKFGQAVYGLSVADFNDDGWMDFAASHATRPLGYSTISIFYNQGDLTFTQKDVYSIYEHHVKDLESGDFDNDGDIDLLFAYTEYIWYDDLPWNLIGVYCMLENEGDETFGSEKVIAERGRDLFFYFGPYFYMKIQVRIRNFLGLDRYNPQLTSADYDADGDIDFLVGDNSGKVEHFINDGYGNFVSNGVIHWYGHLSWGLTSGDFDGDGDIDFLVAANNKYGTLEGNVWLKRNQLN